MIPLLHKKAVESETPSEDYGLPVLSALPWSTKVMYASSYPPDIRHASQNSSAIAYQYLTSNLLTMAQEDATKRCLLLSSSCKEKSPSWVVMNLVYYLSQMGQKVLLIDADFQSPTVHQAFDIDFEDGMHLSEFLWENNPARSTFCEFSDWRSLRSCFQTTPEIPELYILPNVKAAPFSFEMLDFDALEQMFSRLKAHFDWIILDSAPLLEYPKAIQLARYTGGILLLQDRFATVNRMLQIQTLCSNHEIPLLGVIQRGGQFFKLSPQFSSEGMLGSRSQ